MNITYHAKANCFVYDDATQLASCPGAKLINGTKAAIPNNLELLQALSKQGILVPNPMVNYEWPHGPGIDGPLVIQKAMAGFMALNPACFNLSEMRTGKTLAALWAADKVMREEGGKCLIVAQLSTLRHIWGQNIFTHFLGKRTYEVLTGSAERRERLLARDVDFYITNYEGLSVGAKAVKHKIILQRFSKAVAARSDIRIAIIDEASAYRDARSLRSRVAQQLIVPRPYIWLLTGTPATKAPTDAYGLAKIVNNVFGESYKSFEDRTTFVLPERPLTRLPRLGAERMVAEVLQPSIRFTQADAFDAPQCVTLVRECELSTQQRKLWTIMRKQAVVMIKEKTINAVNEAAIRTKLLQITAGAIYDEDHNIHILDCASRIKVMKEVIEEAPKKVIVFCHLTSVLDMLSTSLASQAHVLIDGRVTGIERDKRMIAFEREDGPRILLANPGPIARGQDFTSAATIIWFLPTDNTEHYIQGNERINGPKQKNKMTIVHIAATALEREIYKRLQENQRLQGSILKLLED